MDGGWRQALLPFCSATHLFALALVALVLLVVGVLAPVPVAVGVVPQERVVGITGCGDIGLTSKRRGEEYYYY